MSALTPWLTVLELQDHVSRCFCLSFETRSCSWQLEKRRRVQGYPSLEAADRQGHLPELAYRADHLSCNYGIADHDCKDVAQGPIGCNACWSR
jgi:hypothetical protein